MGGRRRADDAQDLLRAGQGVLVAGCEELEGVLADLEAKGDGRAQPVDGRCLGHRQFEMAAVHIVDVDQRAAARTTVNAALNLRRLAHARAATWADVCTDVMAASGCACSALATAVCFLPPACSAASSARTALSSASSALQRTSVCSARPV